MIPYRISVASLLVMILLLMAACGSQRKVAKDTEKEQTEEVSYLRSLESTALMIDASKEKTLGNTPNAIVLYAEALRADPNNAAAHYELAKIHAQKGHLKDAETFAKRATQLEPDNVFYSMVLADVYFLQSKNEQGYAIQKGLAQKNSNNLNIQISFLSTLLYLSKYEEALQQFEHIETISGFNVELSMQKQKILLELERYEQAVAEAEKLITYLPDEPVYLELLAELYEEAGMHEKVYSTYQRMLEIQPDNAMARLLMADYYRKEGNRQESFIQLRKAFESPRLDKESKGRILFTYYQLSENDETYLKEAYELINIMLEMHPDDAETNAIYGDFLFRDGKQEEARAYFLRAAKLEPSELRFWQQVLLIDSSLEDYEHMLKTSEEALEYFFEQPLLFLFNGLANYQLKNYGEAISAFNYGRDLSLSDRELEVQFLTLLGDAHHKAGNHSASDRAYEQALELDPRNAFALNNYSYHMSVRGINLEKALKMSARALDVEPNNAAFLDTFGWIHYQKGNYKEAQKWINKSLENTDKPSATVLEHYGDVLYKLQQKEEALQYWQKALKAADDSDDDAGSEFLRKKVQDQTLYE